MSGVILHARPAASFLLLLNSEYKIHYVEQYRTFWPLETKLSLFERLLLCQSVNKKKQACSLALDAHGVVMDQISSSPVSHTLFWIHTL